MTAGQVFKRYEIKYMLTQQQKEAVLQAMQPCMALDRYGRSTIRNIYYDTDNYQLIRRSLDKPVYKEKLRIRSYHKATSQSTVFVELKKKFAGVVYKRRIPLPEKEALDWLSGGRCPRDCQIGHEIDYFKDFYQTLHPTVFLSYAREAYCCADRPDFRVTFDDTILCRQENISLETDIYGSPLLEPGMTLMEVKCAGGIPLWMTRVLTRERIFKTSFSKYGTAYQRFVYPKIMQEANSNV